MREREVEEDGEEGRNKSGDDYGIGWEIRRKHILWAKSSHYCWLRRGVSLLNHRAMVTRHQSVRLGWRPPQTAGRRKERWRFDLFFLARLFSILSGETQWIKIEADRRGRTLGFETFGRFVVQDRWSWENEREREQCLWVVSVNRMSWKVCDRMVDRRTQWKESESGRKLPTADSNLQENESVHWIGVQSDWKCDSGRNEKRRLESKERGRKLLDFRRWIKVSSCF